MQIRKNCDMRKIVLIKMKIRFAKKKTQKIKIMVVARWLRMYYMGRVDFLLRTPGQLWYFEYQ